MGLVISNYIVLVVLTFHLCYIPLSCDYQRPDQVPPIISEILNYILLIGVPFKFPVHSSNMISSDRIMFPPEISDSELCCINWCHISLPSRVRALYDF
jgi:hypothetical protein